MKELYQDFDEVDFFLKKYNSLFRNLELMQEVLKSKQLKAYHECATYLKYVVIRTQEGEYIKKLVAANFCKNRFCSVCNWRRALKYRSILSNRLNLILKKQRVKFIFLTLTIKNTHYKSLKKDLKHILSSFTRLFKFKRISKNPSILGYIRTLEFTLQKNNLEYINLHIHTLLCVKPVYFDTKKNYYINQKEWTSLWQRALNVDYIPIVDVRFVKKRRQSEYCAEELAVFEVVKYILKDTDLLRLQKSKRIDVFKQLYYSFKNVRALSFGGIFAPKNFKEKLDKEEDLINIKDSEIKGEVLAEVEYVLKDRDSGYVLKNLKELKSEKN